MNYSSVIRDELDNTRQKASNKNIINSIKSDIEKTTRDMFVDSEAPIKSETFNLDTTDIVGLDTSQSLAVVGDTIIVNNVYSLKEISLTANNLSDISPIITSSVINITVVDSDGLELSNEDANVELDTLLHYSLTSISYSDMVGMTITITLVSIGTDINSISISQLDYTKIFTRLELPSYVFVPFGASFKVSNDINSANYSSKEMTEDEYNRWTPFGGVDNRDVVQEVLVINGSPATTAVTIENIEFDNRVGYFFTVIDDKLYLMFKPAVKGAVIIRFSYIPVLNIEESKSIPIHQAFINGIIDGVTVRQLNKLIMDVTDEVSLIKLKGAISMYHESFRRTVNKFAGYNRKKTGVRSIKMIGILEDPSMIIM